MDSNLNLVLWYCDGL